MDFGVWGGGIFFINLVRVEDSSGNMAKTSTSRSFIRKLVKLLHVEVLSEIGLKLLRRS